MSFELSIALRYLKTKRHGLFAVLTTLIAISGVTLGVAALIVTLAVMTGFRSDIQDKTLGIQPHIILLGTEKDSMIALESLAEKIKRMPEIEAAAPFIVAQTLFKTAHAAQGVIVRGILPEKEFAVTNVKKTLITGDWSSIAPGSKEKNVILGIELARTLGVGLGGEVLAFSTTETAAIGLGSVPKIDKLTVAGTFQSGYYEYDANMALISLAEAQTLFGIPGATGIGVRTDDLDKAEELTAKVLETAGLKYWARSWQSMNRNLFEALKLEKIVMGIILTMIILVASFTIISNLILMSIEKSRDIGILKALGASRSSIKKIFLYAGMCLGMTGVFLGTVLGIIIVQVLQKTRWIKLPQDVYYLDILPVKLSPGDLLMVIGAALLITLLSAVYPASQAAKVNPVDAIRYG